MAKAPKGEITARVRRAAEMLRLDHVLRRRPWQLSGGQRQRVAIGRALVRDPDVFLFDEPMSNLDAALRTEMRIELLRLHRQLGATMLFVTHDQVEAMTMADAIVVLNGGRIEQEGDPLHVYHNPRNRFVAGFLGSPGMNFIEAGVRSVDGSTLEVAFADRTLVLPAPATRLSPGDPVTLGVRPEHLSLSGASSVRLLGVIALQENLGAETVLHVDACAGRLLVRVGGIPSYRVGDAVVIGFEAANCCLFDREGKSMGAACAPGAASQAPLKCE
jgi:multiple sugar transport system ATP-binding protein